MEVSQKEYIATGGIKCPHCGKGNIDSTDFVETDIGCAWQNAKCEDCGLEWTDEYTLTSISCVSLDGKDVEITY